MQDKKDIVLVGYSGHGYVVYDAVLLGEQSITSYCDYAEVSFNPFNLEYIGNEGSDSFDWSIDCDFALGLGDNKLRVKVGDYILSKNKNLITVIHPKSIVSQYSTIGVGSFINVGAIINAFAKIGEMCIINSAAVVEHECVLAKGVHIAPGTVLAGNVSIGENSLIGANSVVRQGIKIGSNCTIGAGSVIVKDIADNSVVYGNPAK
ncbi:2,3,4,5-tetrahydropyridine-2,6-dicarboxylate N-acetyltransferase [Myroides odoratimimus]|uniref:acetyltransferase n=1 Tax=Myroides odoratimimus TaxID=76832 RepID=UPI00072B749A|nr:acetyltransferase [Myroides odoratimimus]GAQ14825.1 2,3,4,5-tetrahydropyridine-2,6-dicarboxylate N-acetyltransferase [Myroides odoratimimus]STZ48882.1 2,3,4,5-tetrahydropyridine-2,6-dicarboxylate N-acetyltransferase [Myroides odoratimimus]